MTDPVRPTLTARWRAFDALTVHELHAILKLRGDVFVVEQACAFVEIDGLDPKAEHLSLVTEDGVLAGYLRFFAPGVLGEAEVRLGRIVVAPAFRGLRLGDRLMREGLQRAADRHPARPVVLSAQAHLERFYASHGFCPYGETYLEDGIPHVHMRRDAGPA
ncbi:GNAT family N-acetyltransferase [Microvirga tunisiensis]|uniref:GNAT family N-acetyltransferase n=2 Tax=Pannonibacter tanglangensis TaxID=2750084 RepID=A0A7X5EZK1_9HYPH|nr:MULTISPECIES: GNAT family N-acetyltransferase [unclassified Pannonibacter]NBN63398.1 GNAT family N-acetyltransferase [Pannonibacter sp. XCT-34]NBN77033.1 GNAT family N-acetyltransferase [Pannonibacter sp. XCT-53]